MIVLRLQRFIAFAFDLKKAGEGRERGDDPNQERERVGNEGGYEGELRFAADLRRIEAQVGGEEDD